MMEITDLIADVLSILALQSKELLEFSWYPMLLR